MNRRQFIQAAFSTLLIPHALVFGNTEVPEWEWAVADWFFYDDRFPLARQLASELSGSTDLTPVQGDITGIWNSGLGRACRQSMLTLQGVTTESFHFCLKTLVAENVRAQARVTRIDRDLFLWQIICGQPINRDVIV